MPTPAAPARRADWPLLAARVPPALRESVRAAVVSLAGTPHALTLAELLEGALERELARLARRHNGGRAWRRRGSAGALPPGPRPRA